MKRTKRKPLLRIVAPHFVAGVEIRGSIAPIIRYMMGWSAGRIKGYCGRKGWKVGEIGK